MSVPPGFQKIRQWPLDRNSEFGSKEHFVVIVKLERKLIFLAKADFEARLHFDNFP